MRGKLLLRGTGEKVFVPLTLRAETILKNDFMKESFVVIFVENEMVM